MQGELSQNCLHFFEDYRACIVEELEQKGLQHLRGLRAVGTAAQVAAGAAAAAAQTANGLAAATAAEAAAAAAEAAAAAAAAATAAAAAAKIGDLRGEQRSRRRLAAVKSATREVLPALKQLHLQQQ
ncbi:hypothetical protein Efla_003910 [Eimeria flavescens]